MEPLTRDERYMHEALGEAKRAAAEGEVPVGAVIVLGDEIIARAHNLSEREKSALLHAETGAIAAASKVLGDWRLSGCELFVTLEPCAMCAGAILNSRLRRVVFGAFDAAAGCMGSVTDLSLLPFAPKMELLGGVLEHACADLLKAFFERRRSAKAE